jgi:FtsP/CotA-like multicopper oxidase with cupredoxin domain
LTVVTTAGLLTALAPPIVAHAAVPSAVLAVPAMPTLAAVAAGKLPINGCVEGAASATCDLYAMSGTATILGVPIPIWGFSKTGAAGSATAPGPVLVVRQGDAVTLTLHNQLAGQTVSLALPGQVGVTVAGAVGDDTTGIASGTRAYSFTAGRPGTFLYEAGHTAGGARQVAMGLAGALVVLPADGTAYGNANTAYDDEAVLVLTEVDPAFNAAPTTFDLRNFEPAYRLINGKPFPASDPISTDQGHRLLLRYVNAGSLPHTMTLLGAGQNLIAQDGHLMAYAAASVTQTVAPGATADSTVAVPNGSEAKLALYESAQHLDNAGQHNADPLQLAFGGMMTFVDTNAPVPSTDGVGPVSSHISVTPNPSDGLSNATVKADLSDATTGGSNVTQAEFVIDDAVATGAGFGVPLTGTFGTVSVTGATGVIPATAGSCTPPSGPVPVSLECLAAGKHQLFVRALDSAGNWGVIGSTIFNLPKTGPQTTSGSATPTPTNGSADVSISATGDDSGAGGVITNAEYFIDTVGANGAGIALTVNRAAAIVSEDGDILAATVAGLGEGLHHVFVHSKDSLGLWGPTLDIPLNVDVTGPTVDAAAVGPNPTNGLVSDKSNPGYLVVSAQITDRDAGNGLQNLLADAEAFLDPKVANPAGGTGLNMIAVDGQLNSTTEAVYGLIPLSQAKALTDGVHHVFVRGQDNAGNWGALFAVNVLVDKVAPVLGTLTASPNPTNGASSVTLSAPLTELNTLGSSEYWTGSVDPGVGRGTALPVSVAGGQVSVSVPLAGLANGTYTFNLRVQDLAGNWSNSKSVSVTVVRPNAIFADNFNSGTTAAWSSTTGTPTVTPAAGIPVTAGNSGLAVTLPGNATNSAKFVRDTTPAVEPTYHAQFAFNPNTLTSGTNPATAVITIFDARTAANAAVFTVQYRVSAGSKQVRTVMTRNTGGTLTGAWVTLSSGAHTLKVDWAAGPATGATAGSLKLSVDGVVVQTGLGNTNTLRIESVNLGIISGFSVGAGANRSAGTAYFDSFVSTRYTLP